MTVPHVSISRLTEGIRGPCLAAAAALAALFAAFKSSPNAVSLQKEPELRPCPSC